jgi:hypothetical protein
MKLESYVRFVAFAVFVSRVLIVGCPARAQTGSRGQESGTFTQQMGGRSAAPSSLKKHALKGTYFDTSSPGASAFCSSASCSAFAAIYSESIVCPVAAGAKCTYQLTIQSQSQAGSNDGNVGEEGVYQFLVDGVAPIPGPVGPPPCSCYTWSGASRQFSFAIRGTSYAVTATVKNTTANQAHTIAVNIGCNEVQGNASGCFANSGFANLSIATYAP